MIHNAFLIIAAGLIVAGCALIWLPAGMIAAGLLVGAFVLLSE